MIHQHFDEEKGQSQTSPVAELDLTQTKGLRMVREPPCLVSNANQHLQPVGELNWK